MSIEKKVIDHLLSTPLGEEAYKVTEVLVDNGFDAWWVGGAVRDLIQGNLPTDIDIGTDAHPEQIFELFTKSYEASRGLGGVRVVSRRFTFEITTFREESDSKNSRHPEHITFGSREQDAKRRDFTVNAMYVNPISRELFDPYSGAGDAKESLVRFIGEPGTRIHEDALRILRAVRFRAQINGQYHPDTYAALREHASSVEKLSGTRVLEEVEKILKNRNPGLAFEDLWELRILEYILPEIASCKGIAQPAEYHEEGDVWEHLKQCIEHLTKEDTPDVRLGILLHDIGKVQTFSLKERIRFNEHASVSADLAKEILSRLSCPKKRIEKICWLIEHHMMMGSFFDMTDERKAHWYHHEWFAELLRIFELDIAGTTPANYELYEKILKDYHEFLDTHPRPQKPFLTGEEIMEILDLEPGERVGEIANLLKEAQVRKEVQSKKEAEEFIQKQA